MANPRAELVRLLTVDGLELQGLLFEPARKTRKAIVHVHGWIGNFYENKFIDAIAQAALANGYSFLTFNNRGVGIVTDFIKRHPDKTRYERIGGCWEHFEDCLVDLRAALACLSARGYRNILLEGHSLGCQKIAYYQSKTHDKRVKGLILLAPVDDVGFVSKQLGKKYAKALSIAKQIKRTGKRTQPVPEWMQFYPLLNAEVFLNIATTNSTSGRIFDFGGKLHEIKAVNCPVLAVFGSEDNYQAKPAEKLGLLRNQVQACKTALIAGADHGFAGRETALARCIRAWLKAL